MRVAMARWLVVVASALWAGAGAAYADADYSAARMPQYDSLNYDTHAASPPADDYRDRSPDVAAPLDYNHYDQESNDKRNPKILHVEDSYHEPAHSNIRKESTTMALDYIDADYSSFKPEKKNPKTKYNNKMPRNRNKIEANGSLSRRSKLGSDVKKYQHIDDEDTEVPFEHFEEEKDLGSDGDKSKFVRRDISQKVWRKSRNQAASEFRDTDYDDQSEVKQVKNAIKSGGPIYSDPDMPQDPLIGDDIGPNRAVAAVRPPGYKTGHNENDDSELSPSRQPGRYKAPMPKARKNNEYVDYNDMSRIEKLKNLSSRRTTAKPGASRRWSFQDGFRRRYFSKPQEAEEYAEILTTAQTKYSSVAYTSTNATPPWLITGADETLVPLSKDIIENITAFVNQSKQLSIAELSQLSIRKKAERKDSVKDQMLKDKPPVLLQVTERVQTVVMVEPPPVTQEPWLRARDIAEDSPERIAKVKRFMRNKLVASARNISELMENWDDTVCDYVDISLLDESSAVRTRSHSSYAVTVSTASPGSAAERELQAALSRKEVSAGAGTTPPQPTLRPGAVDPYQEEQWNQFVFSNHTPRHQPTTYVCLITLLHCLLTFIFL